MGKVIFDLGMCNGRDALFYLLKGFKVIGVEADPNLCNEVRIKLKQFIDSGQLIIEECAISDYNGEIDFTLNKSHLDWGSLGDKWNSKYNSETEKIKVKCSSINHLYWKHVKEGDKVRYIKIDLEGYDIECIKQFIFYRIPPPDYMSVELLTYNNISTEESSSEMFYLLKQFGYTKFQLVDQSNNHLVKCPNPPLEGSYYDFHFNGYSSGLFGKELPDNWVSMDKALLQYLDYFCNKTYQNSWWDLHVTK